MSDLPELSWRSHPARRQPRRFWAAVVVLVSVGVGGLLASGSVLVALAMAAVLWGTSIEFFVPTQFRIDREGVAMRRPGVRKHHPWSRVRRVVRERRGLLLSPFASRRWLEERRGIYLRYAGNEAAVRDAVAAHVAANEGAS